MDDLVKKANKNDCILLEKIEAYSSVSDSNFDKVETILDVNFILNNFKYEDRMIIILYYVEKFTDKEKEKNNFNPIEKGKSKLTLNSITKIESSDKIISLNLSKQKLDTMTSTKSLAQQYNTLLEDKKIELFDNKIYVGVIYNIIEFFNNCNFNMNRLIPIDFSDLRNMLKSFN